MTIRVFSEIDLGRQPLGTHWALGPASANPLAYHYNMSAISIIDLSDQRT